jgi:aldehyde dehydrogenase (NAD+)
LDRTHKQYIGGKQARPDSAYSLTVSTASGGSVEVARGNRKDIRNAVEAARVAQPGWASQTAHSRAQILYYLAENLSVARAEMIDAIAASNGNPEAEFEAAIERTMLYAAWADKYDGHVHTAPWKGVIYTLNEPIGVVSVVASPEAPLVGLLSLILPAVALGNTVVALPSEVNPLPAVELYRILEMSDVPAGVVNICTGLHSEMAPTLAGHDDIDAIWHFGSPEGAAEAEKLSIGNLKQTWVPHGPVNWAEFTGREVLRHACQVKNVWVPVGE